MTFAKLAVLALATGSAGLFTMGAWRGHAHGSFGRRHPALMLKFIDFAVNEKLEEIGATETQKQKVRAVEDRLVRDGRALHEGRGVLKERVLTLLAQDNPDPAQLKALIRERTDALSRFGDEAADALLEIHGALTPEQRQKLLADARAHFEERGH